MDNENDEIIEEICKYAEKYAIKDMLQEYLKRVILAKPADPVAFLIKTIEENPVLPPGFSEEPQVDEE
jgi:hypothetical protein